MAYMDDGVRFSYQWNGMEWNDYLVCVCVCLMRCMYAMN